MLMRAHAVERKSSPSTTHHWLHICPLPVPSQSANHVCSLICHEGTCSCLMVGEENMKKTKVNDQGVKESYSCWQMNKWYFSSTYLKPTSKPTETSLLIVFADVWLVIPPDCGSQVFRGSDWSFSVKRGWERKKRFYALYVKNILGKHITICLSLVLTWPCQRKHCPWWYLLAWWTFGSCWCPGRFYHLLCLSAPVEGEYSMHKCTNTKKHLKICKKKQKNKTY